MYGAVCGDIIGSRFEFDRGGKTKEFALFTQEDEFTDDTVMTIAVGEGLMNAGLDASIEEIKASVTKSMKIWGKRYPDAGYGGRFIRWVLSEDSKPYGSFGNGSAMRVSAAGWLYDSIERTREVARATAEVSHNHPEGIKGAECTAAVIFLGRMGMSKGEISEYVSQEFGYDYSESLDEMRMRHEHVETCQDSLPKALRSFFDGESYEDVVRNAVSLGGDTDTLAAIAGAMAEGYYGMPIQIIADGVHFLTDDITIVLNRFYKIIGRGGEEREEDRYKNNIYIKYAVQQVNENREQEAFFTVLEVLLKRMLEDGEAPAPMVAKSPLSEVLNLSNVKLGETRQLTEDLRMTIDKVQDSEGEIWTPLYTDEEEVNKGETPGLLINLAIVEILREACGYEKSQGLVINPFGERLVISKEIIKTVLDLYDQNRENFGLRNNS